MIEVEKSAASTVPKGIVCGMAMLRHGRGGPTDHLFFERIEAERIPGQLIYDMWGAGNRWGPTDALIRRRRQ